MALAKIRELSDEAFAKLEAVFRLPPTTLTPSQFASNASKRVPGLARDELQKVVDMLFSLYIVRADADAPLSVFTSDLLKAIDSSGRKELVFSAKARSKFQARLASLLDNEVLRVALKALALRAEHAKTFCECRIISDIRPIFAKPQERPLGAVITHTLKIAFHQQGEHSEFYVAMDSDDLANLKRAIDRAQSKADALRGVLAEAGIPDLYLK